ncbi:AraC family transcriptional regulator [Oceanospirillum sediminis]|uniref:Helix-turn-helix transcriptional regulator n=1 Tax=Oceanospirillum sediminis TaxID=2760088 RepID=A0A839INX3_9GAMM|nr:helix-turn-helix transcriptional regulator [Oceanospirillum sediminis]MBB1487193.1 helix-turn-helix transcriptional regulator [Oceanospirillum sediminis]
MTDTRISGRASEAHIQKQISSGKRIRSTAGQVIDPLRPVIGMQDTMPANLEISYHSHPRGQLAYASEGILKIYTDDGIWIVPPTQAVWIPGNIRHSVNAEITAEIRHLFIDPSHLQDFPDQCSVLEMHTLLKELILRVADFGREYQPDSPASRVCAVILDELTQLQPSQLHLPFARDKRLQKVMQMMIKRPDAEPPLAFWADQASTSERTLSRLFIKETGMNFSQWRRQLLLQEAVRRLNQKESVTHIALELGYRSTSAFVAMFRQALGKPPGQYLKQI